MEPGSLQDKMKALWHRQYRGSSINTDSKKSVIYDI